MSKIKARSISGVPEWLPAERRIEQAWMDRLRALFERFAYLPVETSSIELLEVLRSKGEIDKEIYTLTKPQADTDPDYGLHYDLTVPFARYVVQNYGSLSFPFRRYQMQKIWRGERPQRGRYREFYQCDIDVIDNDSLSPYFDFEVLYLGSLAMAALDLPPFVIGVSNRKIYEGYLEALGVGETPPVLRILDKKDKVGEDGVRKMLRDDLGLSNEVIEKALLPAAIASDDLSFAERFRALGVRSEKAEQGIAELEEVMRLFFDAGGRNAMVDLSFVRGLDYYTGIIFEGHFTENPGLGSVCSGGRYDNLAERFTNRHLPGVGFSIGLSRIFGMMVEEQRLPLDASPPVEAIVLRTRPDDLPQVFRVAQALRSKGLRVEVYSDPAKLGKQFKYAGRNNIPWVWVASEADPNQFEVKNMRTGEQAKADPEAWSPPAAG